MKTSFCILRAALSGALLQQLLSSFGGSVVVEDSEQKDAAENAVPKKVAKWSNAGEGDYNAETIVCYNCNCMVLRPENGVFCAAEVNRKQLPRRWSV